MAIVALWHADLHVATSAWAGRDISGDAVFTFKQIVDYAIKHDVKHIFGGGDLLDQQRNRSKPVTELSLQLKRLQDHNITYWFIEGQHEMDTPPWLSGLPATRCLDKKLCRIETLKKDIYVYGLSYRNADILAEELKAIPPKADILLAHQVWSEFMGDIANPQGALRDVPVVRTIFTGDYHVNKEIEVTNPQGMKTFVISPGSSCMQSIDEQPDKYFYAMMDDGELWSRRQLLTRPKLADRVIVSMEELDAAVVDIPFAINDAVVKALEKGIPEHIAKPLMRVRYSASLEKAGHRITQAVAGKAHLFLNEMPVEQKPLPLDIGVLQDAEQITMDVALRGLVDKTKKPRLFTFCQDLLNANEAERIIEALATDYLSEDE